ncbi:hypothetical protein BH11PAT4_BH11PAT4_7220 [soil metagenome]
MKTFLLGKNTGSLLALIGVVTLLALAYLAYSSLLAGVMSEWGDPIQYVDVIVPVVLLILFAWRANISRENKLDLAIREAGVIGLVGLLLWVAFVVYVLATFTTIS